MDYKTALDAIIAALITAGVGVLVVVIKSVGAMLVKFIQAKIEAVQAKIGIDEYEKKKQFAFDAWRIVDEYFRITPAIEKTVEAAQAKFSEEIKKLIPAIADEEIESLRQAVAGVINEGKGAVLGIGDDEQ